MRRSPMSSSSTNNNNQQRMYGRQNVFHGQLPQSRQQQQQFNPIPVDTPPVETVVARLETACRLLHGVGSNSTRVSEIASEIQILSDDLRLVGPHLEAYPDVLDKVMSSMRDASAQPLLPKSLRLAIFEIVELRAAKWMLPNDSLHYYRQRRIVHECNDDTEEDNENDAILGKIFSPGTDLNSIAGEGKTYREEILIKNSDSGKVGALAKDRVLSINGYSQQSISMAKQLIQETINRNASPVFDSSANTMSSSSSGNVNPQVIPNSNSPVLELTDLHPGFDLLGQYTYTVTVNGDETIRLSGGNFALVQEAKLALEDYFSSKHASPNYTREELLNLRSALQSNMKPDFTALDKIIVEAIVLDKSKCTLNKGGQDKENQIKKL